MKYSTHETGWQAIRKDALSLPEIPRGGALGILPPDFGTLPPGALRGHEAHAMRAQGKGGRR